MSFYHGLIESLLITLNIFNSALSFFYKGFSPLYSCRHFIFSLFNFYKTILLFIFGSFSYIILSIKGKAKTFWLFIIVLFEATYLGFFLFDFNAIRRVLILKLLYEVTFNSLTFDTSRELSLFL